MQERYVHIIDAWGRPLTAPQAGYVATATDTTQVSYSGNHLTDGSNYAYDANGNLTKDLGRGIVQISYNLLNLPSNVAPGLVGGPHGVIYGADSRDYLYTASGVKLQSKAMLPLNLPGMPDVRERTDYVGNLIYDRTSLQKVLFDGGYVDMSGDSPEYRFFVTDHLGNNRLVADAAGTILQTNHYDPYGESLPAGSAVDSGNPYKYGGKEYDDKALAYDFGARHYTSSIPRWTTMDPMAEKYYSISPYAYCAGNPMNYVDPKGKKVIARDSLSQQAIRNTLSSEENQYVRFSKRGKLKQRRLNTGTSSSINFNALKELSNSKTKYIVNVADSYDSNGEKTKLVDHSENGTNGVTLIPGAEKDPSPDDNVHVYISLSLSAQDQALNLSHELFGHALLYEWSLKGIKVSPYHQYIWVQIGEEEHFVEGYRLVYPINGREDTNSTLVKQIEASQKETMINFNSRNFMK